MSSDHLEARPTPEAGMPATAPIGVSEPSLLIRNSAMRASCVVSAYRNRPLPLIARSAGWLPAPVSPVRPSALRRVTEPSAPMLYPLIDMLPVFVVYTNRPSFETIAQHAAVWSVGALALATVQDAAPDGLYEESALAPGTPPNASVTKSCPLRSKSNPKGVIPGAAVVVSVPSHPPGSTGYVSTRFVFFSVTTTLEPSGLNLTSAGPAEPQLSERV